MNTVDFEYSFSDLEITLQDIKDNAPEGGLGLDDFSDIINELIHSGDSFVHAKGGYTILDMDVQEDKGLIQLQDENLTEHFEVGKIITKQLATSEKGVVFACTAGKGIREKYDYYTQQQDFLHAYLVDLLGTISVENAMDKIQSALQDDMKSKGLNITNRYSPGYCGWNVKEQHQLFRFLPNNYCGISLTETALMIPIKSVSGIIGIGKNVHMQEYTCGICQLDHCLYRRKSKITSNK